MADEIPIEDASAAVPCDEASLRTWLQQGLIRGRDSFGRRDQQISPQSVGVVIDIESLKQHCADIGVKPDFGRKNN